MRDDQEQDGSATFAVFRVAASGVAIVLLWLAQLVVSMVSPSDLREPEHRRWPMIHALHERLSQRIAVDFIIVRSKVDLWLARRIRRRD